ncbi:MAG: GDP-mannose 4,6-dehydratase [candidate division KSB1 bacterium]|nr:GDP-mannose 4,6-dehydratase [candidate division KSB1 bacterium]MDZ7357042.1 GDP-mannose 4,6-dehydratase [candidate division KSB1 bacterium]MDZ7376701.1 GDP-mannose 4,6-dehydratase [candidate division KSB1 bacterium]MDZ7398825.1 GDP-mannose 4,6-dehydratase [candidate division KSB1 bacterium]
MNWQNEYVLVTGGAGFIGSHLTEKLVELGAKVRVLVHYNSRNHWGNLEYLPKNVLDQVEIFLGDVQDPYSVQKAVAGCSVVFHLASLIAIPYSYVAPASYVETNIKGSLNVMEACLRADVNRVVHTSTSETYGTAMYTPIDERHPLQGQSPYSASKIGADKIVESYYRSFDLPVSTLRPFNTFGPRQSARAVIPTIIAQALTSRIVELGALDPVRDLTYVKDTVMGFIKIAESEKTIGEVINIGNGKGIAIGELAKRIVALIGKDIEVRTNRQRLRPEKSEVMKLICDYSKAEAFMNWKPNYTLDEGLKETIEFIRANLSHYKPEIYNI